MWIQKNSVLCSFILGLQIYQVVGQSDQRIAIDSIAPLTLAPLTLGPPVFIPQVQFAQGKVFVVALLIFYFL